MLENEKKIEVSKPGYTEELTIPYLGKNHKIDIKILDSQKEKSAEGQKNSVVYKNGRFLFTILPNTKNNQNYNDEIRTLHDDWLYHKAEIIFSKNPYLYLVLFGSAKCLFLSLRNEFLVS